LDCLVGEERDTELLVNHQGKDAHHGGTAVVKLDGALAELGLLIEGVPSVVDGSVTEVTNELGLSGQVTHDRGLKNTNEEKELNKTSGRDGLEGSESVGDGLEGGSTVVDGSGETDTGFLDKVSNNGKHGDTAVLQLNKSKAVELLLVTIGNKSEGIEESQRRLGTKLVLEGLDGGGGAGSGLGNKGRSGGEDRGGDNRLHLEFYERFLMVSASETNPEESSLQFELLWPKK